LLKEKDIKNKFEFENNESKNIKDLKDIKDLKEIRFKSMDHKEIYFKK
jgi:hypothetical protein